MEKIILNVTGMICSHCEKAVTNALKELGVLSIMANAKENVVELEYDRNKLSIEQIKAKIFDTGYEVV